MRKILQTTFLFFLFLSLTGCFEITEEVKMKADGSGELILTVDLSQSKDNLAGYLKSGEANGVEIPSEAEIEMEILKIKNVIANVPGMTDVKTERDFKEFVFKISGNFKDIKTLNNAINTAIDASNKTIFPIPKMSHFANVKNKFSRLFEYTDERFTKEEYDGLGAVPRYIMESAKLVSIYRFENPVKNVSNKKAKVAPSKKAVMLEGNLAEFVKGEKSLENHISY